MPDPVTYPQRRTEVQSLYDTIKELDAELTADAQAGILATLTMLPPMPVSP